MTQKAPKMAQGGAKRGQNGPKVRPGWPKKASREAKMTSEINPRRSKIDTGRTTSKKDEKRTKK